MVEKLSKTTISKRKEQTNRKPKSELESKSFRDGAVYLFKRADYVKPTWFCRVKVPGAKGYISQSTKTTDEHLAFKFADDLYLKGLAEVASGRDISSKKVSVAISEFIDGYSETEKKKPTAITRSKFLTHTATFFGNRRLKEVNTKVLAELNDWTVENSRTGILSPNTIKRYTTDLKQFFNWCYERSYIDALPRFPKLKTVSNRRPHFDQKDWAKLKDVKAALNVSKPYYAPWEMDKATGFDSWWKSHAHLFEEKYTVREMRAGDLPADPEALIIEVPLTQSPTILTRKVRDIIQAAHDSRAKKTKKAKTKPSAYYKLSEGSEPKFDAIREMLSIYRDVYLKDKSLRGDKLLEATHNYYLKRKNKRYAKVPMSFQHGGSNSNKIGAMRNLRRYIQKAEKVVLNVARGQFPGTY